MKREDKLFVETNNNNNNNKFYTSQGAQNSTPIANLMR